MLPAPAWTKGDFQSLSVGGASHRREREREREAEGVENGGTASGGLVLRV